MIRMRSLSRLASLCVMVAATPALAGWDYAKLDRKLREGERPKVILNLEKCSDTSGTAGPPVTAVLTFTTYNLTKQFIATSDTHLFEAANGAMLLAYTRLRAFPGNTVELQLKRLDPATYESVGPVKDLRCNLTDGSVEMVN